MRVGIGRSPRRRPCAGTGVARREGSSTAAAAQRGRGGDGVSDSRSLYCSNPTAWNTIATDAL
uniref:Uncharacterized protein n=1 Tax=Arundo donax TaxID=35708 RepID=A0A0A9AC54_ARUDO